MKRVKIILGLGVVIALAIPSLVLADEIVLKSGQKVEGRIIEYTDKYVKVDSGIGVEVTYYADEIDTVTQIPKGETKDQSAGAFQELKPQTTEEPHAPLEKIRYKMTKFYNFKIQAQLMTAEFSFPLLRQDIVNLKVLNTDMSPQPGAFTKDDHGNKIAHFFFSNLGPGAENDVQVAYDVELDVPKIQIDPQQVKQLSNEQEVKLQHYLGSEGYIDLTDQDVVQKASALVKGKENLYTKAKAIYDYLVNNMTYDKEREGAGQQKPSETLYTQHGICIDIAMLFVTMARSVGIPSRLVDGVAFQMKPGESKITVDIGHAWAEIFLPGYGWVAVDPTFGLVYPENYFCFPYREHICEQFGQLESRDEGSLYENSRIEVEASQKFDHVPIDRKSWIEIERY